MSKHWAWCPSEVHTNTGRLCSAGSRGYPVPRRPRSYAALRLPAPISHGSGSPCRWLTSLRVLVLCPLGRRHVPPPTCRASETGHRLSARPEYSEERRGPPRLRAILFVRALVEHPAGYAPLLAHLSQGHVVAFDGIQHSRHPERPRFRGRGPTARTFVCLRIACRVSTTGARLATGLGGLPLGRAGFAPAGRQTKFHEGIASSNSL